VLGPNRFAVLLFLLLFARAPAQPELMYGSSSSGGSGFGVVAGEAGGAIVAGSALGLGLAYVGVLAAGGAGNLFEFPLLQNSAGIGGMAVGYAAGSALGTWLVGSLASQDHKASWAFVGALVGLPVSLGLVYAADEMEQESKPGALLLIPALAAPPAAAVIGYNLSPACGCAGTARLEDRLLMPSVGLRREPGEAMVVAFDVRLLNVRF